jgi:hypothetical protein
MLQGMTVYEIIGKHISIFYEINGIEKAKTDLANAIRHDTIMCNWSQNQKRRCAFLGKNEN